MAKYKGSDFLVQLGTTAVATAWVTTTVTALGAIVSANGNIYRATVAGTTGATAPSGTGDAIVDGTVTWQFVTTGTSYYTFTTVAGMRSTSSTINKEQVDVTDKGDEQWRQLLNAGIKSMDISLSGVFTDGATLSTLQQDLITGDAFEYFRLISGRGDQFEGLYQIASLERNGEYNGAEQYSMSLNSATRIVYKPAAA